MRSDSRHRARPGFARAVALLLCAAPTAALAGGFYATDRGVRAMGRGGAFVAGADDPHALWYNPAGLVASGRQLLVDASLNLTTIEYTRIDGGGDRLETVTGEAEPLPVPTIAYTDGFGLSDFGFGVGLIVPNGIRTVWPDGDDAPQRYSLLSMGETAMIHAAAGVGWRPIPELSIGAAFHLVTGRLETEVMLSAADGAVCVFPEASECDGRSRLTLDNFVAPVGVFGVTWAPGPVRVGASFSTPFDAEGDATIDVRLPAAEVFDGAEVEGNTGRVSTQFPWILRGGVELLVVPDLRLELATVFEAWSRQKEIAITPDDDVWIRGALGFVDYQIGKISVPREMNDVFSVRLGGEYRLRPDLELRAGGYWERGAFDDAYLTVLTYDGDKVVAGAGVGWAPIASLWIDAYVGYAWLRPREVRGSRVPQANPIRPSRESVGNAVFVGDGDYSSVSPLLGLGLRWMI
jgi:long-chain fatty acid transport protein